MCIVLYVQDWPPVCPSARDRLQTTGRIHRWRLTICFRSAFRQKDSPFWEWMEEIRRKVIHHGMWELYELYAVLAAAAFVCWHTVCGGIRAPRQSWIALHRRHWVLSLKCSLACAGPWDDILIEAVTHVNGSSLGKSHFWDSSSWLWACQRPGFHFRSCQWFVQFLKYNTWI